ncbi:MAG: acyl carrier protein [Actinomycetota bacterium]
MASTEDIFDALREVLVDKLKVEPEKVSRDANLFEDLGLDSIDLMTAVMAVEEKFNIEVEDEELEKVSTLGEASDLLATKVTAGA